MKTLSPILSGAIVLFAVTAVATMQQALESFELNKQSAEQKELLETLNPPVNSASGGQLSEQIEDSILDSMQTNGSFSARMGIDSELNQYRSLTQQGDKVLDGNDVYIEQNGQGSASVYYEQRNGIDNQARVMQNAGFGEEAIANIYQEGSNNLVDIEQLGGNNIANVVQGGTGNEAYISQSAAAGTSNSATVVQFGTENSVIINQR